MQVYWGLYNWKIIKLYCTWLSSYKMAIHWINDTFWIINFCYKFLCICRGMYAKLVVQKIVITEFKKAWHLVLHLVVKLCTTSQPQHYSYPNQMNSVAGEDWPCGKLSCRPSYSSQMTWLSLPIDQVYLIMICNLRVRNLLIHL